LELNFVDLIICLFYYYEIIINASKITINVNKMDQQNFIQIEKTIFTLIFIYIVYVYEYIIQYIVM
jgi:hypothetical protein